MLDRHDEIEALRRVVEGPGPSLSLVTGRPGVGKSLLVERATGNVHGVRYRASTLPDADHRGLVAARVSAWTETEADPADRDWAWIFDEVADRVEARREPSILVLDDAHRLLEARRRWADALATLWSRVRARALPLHVVLCGDAEALVEALGATEPELVGAVTLHLALEPLPYRRVAALVPGWSPADRVRAWAVFGGLPSRLAHLDPSLILATNVQRLVLERDAPLRLAEERDLAVSVQSPARYATLLRSMAAGAREWGEILAGAPELDSGGKMAPYLARLEAAGRIRSERSLDASERSRSRRYHLEDPFTAFWYRLVLPVLTETERGRGAELWSRHVRPGLDAHVEALFPSLCRTWLRLHGDEKLPARAREVGGLWGDGYDLPVSGTLLNGAAFYGTARWGAAAPDASVADRIGRELRETRYGFGREARLRLVFASVPAAGDLVRRSARDPLVHAFDLGDLLGTGQGAPG